MSELANDEFDKDYWFEMYQGQCKTTDDWAKKYRDEVERKADATLLARCEELQRIAEVANAMVGKERDHIMWLTKRTLELEAENARLLVDRVRYLWWESNPHGITEVTQECKGYREWEEAKANNIAAWNRRTPAPPIGD